MERRMLCLKGLGKQRKSSRNVSNPVYRDEQLYLLDIYIVICRILEWNAQQQPNAFELAFAILFLVRAKELCETTLNDFDLLRP
jgi:hypothetical protein